MRIVGGRLKGRVFHAPASRAIRPTSERLRESIFDILAHRHAGCRRRRACRRSLRRLRRAGDRGAVARRRLRAVRRQRRGGARPAARQCRGLGARRRDAHLARRRDAARKAPAGPPFALAFLDPPYDQGLAEPALAALFEGGWLAGARSSSLRRRLRRRSSRRRRLSRRRTSLRRHADRVLRHGEAERARTAASLSVPPVMAHRHHFDTALRADEAGHHPARTRPRWPRGSPATGR